MHFLPDVWVECETCRGQRYNPETLEVRFHGKIDRRRARHVVRRRPSSCSSNIPKIRRILQTLCDVGLDYLTLGQSAPTLSGGEAQRVKLAAELARPDTGRTLYLLDEPTTGLHFDDLAKLLEVLNRLVDQGNTVVVIEHNLDVIKTADWVIDLGPEAGADGGNVVACGTPEQIVEVRNGEWRKAEGRSKKAKRQTPHSPLRTPHSSPTPPSPSRPSSPPGRIVERKPYDPRRGRSDRARTISTSTRSAATRGCRGRSTAAAGTRSDRVGRDGEPCRWDGRILDADRSSAFRSWASSPRRIGTTARSSKSPPRRKSDGWFFHAITGERWLVKLKFRTAKNTFERDKLVAELGLKPLNDLDEIEAYGHGPRVKCKNLRGPWQEVQIDVHSWDEIDTPAFWSFLERAVAGFQKFTERVEHEARRRHAVESARPEVAPVAERVSARQENGVEARGARRAAGDARPTRCRAGSSCGTTRTSCT